MTESRWEGPFLIDVDVTDQWLSPEVVAERTALAELAELLEVSPEDVVRHLGGRWSMLEEGQVADMDRVPGENVWFVSGEPVQVMLAVPARDVVWAAIEVYTAAVEWHGPGYPVVVPGRLIESRDASRLDVLTWLPRALAEAARRRRRGFRWCRECRTVCGPESMSGGVCHGCLTTHHGVVY